MYGVRLRTSLLSITESCGSNTRVRVSTNLIRTLGQKPLIHYSVPLETLSAHPLEKWPVTITPPDVFTSRPPPFAAVKSHKSGLQKSAGSQIPDNRCGTSAQHSEHIPKTMEQSCGREDRPLLVRVLLTKTNFPKANVPDRAPVMKVDSLLLTEA